VGLVLWAGVPFYWLSGLGIRFTSDKTPFDLGTALVLTFFAVGLAIGERKRYTDRSRAQRAARAQQDFWLSR
jgi:hypothetical protein